MDFAVAARTLNDLPEFETLISFGKTAKIEATKVLTVDWLLYVIV